MSLARSRCGGGVFEHVNAGHHDDQDEEMHGEDEEGELDQLQRLLAGEKHRDKADDGVERQYVAPPQQQIMGEADQRQPAAADDMARAAIAAGQLRTIHQQQHRRAEQQGKQPAHLAVDQHEGQEPRGAVCQCLTAPGVGIEIGGFGHGEGNDVHQQYAHHREAARHIHGAVAIFGHCIAGHVLCFPSSVNANRAIK